MDASGEAVTYNLQSQAKMFRYVLFFFFNTICKMPLSAKDGPELYHMKCRKVCTIISFLHSPYVQVGT